MTDKPNLTRVWAKTAPGGNVVDPDTVTANKFTSGWQAEVPPFEYFNFIQKQITEGLAHINEQGIAVWDSVTSYPVDGLAKGSDGNVYKALTSQNNNDPVSDNGTNWIGWEVSNRVIRATSISEVEALSATANHQVSLGGPTSGIFEFNNSNLSSEVTADPSQFNYIAPASDPTGSSGAWVRLIVAGATFSSDVNNINSSGKFYTNETTANRPGSKSGSVESICIDANTATQHYITLESNEAFYRARTLGVWRAWYKVTAKEILTGGWPTITGDNEFYEIPTNTTSGWTVGAGTTLTVVGGNTLNLNGFSNTDEEATIPINQTADGDWVAYMKVSTSINSEYATLDLVEDVSENIGFSMAMNYNWATSSEEDGRISLLVGSASVRLAGPVVDTTVETEIAVYYNDEFEAVTLYVKQAGVWTGYGPVALPRAEAYYDIFRISTGDSQFAVDLKIYDVFFAKPNAVSVGDSITEGATLYAPDPAEALSNYESCWQQYANIYNGVRNSIIVNKGIGSQSSAQINAQLPNVLADTQAKVVFLQASANDFARGITQSQRTDNIQSSVNKITTAGAKVALINSVYANSDSGGSFPAAAEYMKNWWDNELANINDVSIKIDWMAGSGILSGEYMNTTFTQADGIHPTPAGYALLGDYIESLEP